MLFSKKYINENPVIIIPGFMGSIGKDIIPGTGKIGFGPAKHVYAPLIRNLESLGYKKNKDLFVAFYNWRNNNSLSAEKYLVPVIQKAKKISNSDKVDLVCHSMGGLVARYYIQSEFYNNDVDKLIMMGTPNSGSSKSYNYWEGGVLPFEENDDSFMYKALWKGYIWLLKIMYGEKDNLKILHRYCSSVKELLPNKDYGDYLFNQEEDKEKIFIPINEMNIQNDFLNELNENTNELYNKNIKIFQILGYGVKTYDKICVKKYDGDKKIWDDGEPVYKTVTYDGDGTVTNDSSNIVNGKIKYLRSDHSDIVKDSYKILKKILNRKTTNYYHRNRIQNDKIHSIMVKDAEEILFISNDEEMNYNDFISKYENEVDIVRLGYNYWILIKTDKKEDIKIKVKPLYYKPSEICKIGNLQCKMNLEEQFLIVKKDYIMKL